MPPQRGLPPVPTPTPEFSESKDRASPPRPLPHQTPFDSLHSSQDLEGASAGGKGLVLRLCSVWWGILETFSDW